MAGRTGRAAHAGPAGPGASRLRRYMNTFIPFMNKNHSTEQKPADADAKPGAPAAESTATPDAAELFRQLAELQAERDRLQSTCDELKASLAKEEDSLLRTVAEVDLMRKRFQREKDDARRYGAAGLMEDLLTVMDNLGFGLQAAEATAAKVPEAKPVVDGINYIVQQFQGALSGNGLVEIRPAVGDMFDPQKEESVSTEPSDTLPEGAIVRLIRSGYRLHDRLLRPATVVVSSGAPKA